MAKRIPLTQGKFALVSDEDYEGLSEHKWFAAGGNKYKKNWYALRQMRDKSGPRRQRQISMHRVILDAPASMQVDHINGDGLDNRRSNLRLCTGAQNAKNTRSTTGKSEYKGVLVSAKDYISAHIKVDGETLWLGSYGTEVDAARAYDRAAMEHHGDFACLNFENSRAFDFVEWQKRTDQERRERRWSQFAHTPPRTSSGFKGVHKNGKDDFVAQINIRGTQTMVGYSKDPIECAHIYDEHAVEIYGPDCYLNFPENFEIQRTA